MNRVVNTQEVVRRFALFIISLFFSAFGVAFTKCGDLGVSPISSVANVMSIQFSSLSLGTWLILWNCILIAGQICILRKAFQPIQLLQIPLSFLFGYFTDFAMWCVSYLSVNSYLVQVLMVLMGVLLLGFGISLSVIANVIMNSGEAFVKAVSDSIHKDFSYVKIAFDIGFVLLAIMLSLMFFDFAIIGTREGTLLSALCTGMVVKFFCTTLQKPMAHLLSGKHVQKYAASGLHSASEEASGLQQS